MYRHTNKYYRVKERRTTFKRRTLHMSPCNHVIFQEPVTITAEILYHRQICSTKSGFTFGDFSNNAQNIILSCLPDTKIDSTISIIFIPPSAFSYVVFFLDKDDRVKEIVHVISPETEMHLEETTPELQLVPSLFKTMEQIPLSWKTDDIKPLPLTTIFLVCDAKQLHSPNLLITVNVMGEVCGAEYVAPACKDNIVS